MITRTAKCEVLGQKKNGGTFSMGELGEINKSSYFVVKFRTPLLGIPTTLKATVYLVPGQYIGGYDGSDLYAYLLDTSSGETVELSTDNEYQAWTEEYSTFELDAAKLKSNKTYYLKIAPRGDYEDGSIEEVRAASAHVLEITYDCGVVHIDNGTEMEAYQPFVDNGTEWEPVIAYVDNGAGWDVHT